jgi:hypothetical protein
MDETPCCDDFPGDGRRARDRFPTDLTILGRLRGSNAGLSAGHCHIDKPRSSVPCTFDESLRATVGAVVDELVIARGWATFLDDSSIIQAFRLIELERAADRPQTDLSAFGFSEPLTDAEFMRFLRAATSSRCD